MDILFITIVIGIILVLTFSRIVTIEIVEPNKKKDVISLNNNSRNNNNSNLSNNLEKNNNSRNNNNSNLSNNLEKNNNSRNNNNCRNDDNSRNNNLNENSNINTNNINKYDNSINHNKEKYLSENKIGKVNPKSFSQALYQLPEPDSIMSQGMRNQITSLKNKYYYDNCKYIDY